MNEQRSIADRARLGALSLLGRQAVLFPVSFVASVVLARLLTPAQFGTYASATFVVMSAGALLEFGLGAIIIQQPEEPTTRQLRSIFTAQLAIFGTAVLLIAALAPYAANALHLPPDGVWLIRAMSLHMVLGSLGTNSTLLLERRMGFDTFARLDIVNVLLDRGVTLLLAFGHFGPWSFVVGSLTAMTVRVAMLWAAAPWRLGLAFDRAILSRALRYGLTLQATNVTMLVRDNLNTLLGGGLFGPRAVGYLNWAQAVPSQCSNWLVQIAARVSFPAFARLHDDPAARASFLATSLRGLNLASYPALLVLATLGSHVVTFFYSEAWRPALFALDCFVVRTLLTNVTSVLIGYFNATGRATKALRAASAWTVVEVGLALALVPTQGFNGVAIAYAAGPVLPVLMLLWQVRSEARLSYFRVFGVPLLAGVVASAVALFASPYISTITALFATLMLAGGAALGVIAAFERALLQQLLEAVQGKLRPARAVVLEEQA